MNGEILGLLHDLESVDGNVRKPAFDRLLAITDERVDWLEDVFEALKTKLYSKNAFQRSIGVMLLSNLAKSDVSGRLALCADRCLELLEDEKFMTARLTAQAIWKIAVAQPPLRAKVVDALMLALGNSNASPHPNLIRQDIVLSLVRVYSSAPKGVDMNGLKSCITSVSGEPETARLLKLLP